MSTSRAIKDAIEYIVDADDDDEDALNALKEIFFTAMEGELHDEFQRCIGWVLCQMHRDLDNERLQKRGKSVLKDLEDARESHRLSFFFYGQRGPQEFISVIDEIVRFIELDPKNASAARFGFELISHVGKPSLKVSQNTVDVAVDSMVRHKNDPIVQEYAMLCICEVKDDVNVDYLRVLYVVLRAMRNHPDNSHVQVAACNALRLFHDKYEFITRIEWPPVTILHALNNHVHCAEVQRSACDCLGCLLEGVQEGRDHIEANLPTPVGEEFFLAGRDYIEAVLQAMQTHPTNERVQYAALHVLERMTDETTNLNRIVQGGGVDLVIRAMRMFEEETACLMAVMILKPLFGGSTDARREAIELGAVPMLLDVLRRPDCSTRYDLSRSISLCIIVCDALNELFLENLDYAVGLQIAKEGGIEFIVDSIRKNVRRGSLPSSGNINRIRHELKDGDILAHLAMFSADDGKLPLHYAADRGLFPSSEGRMAVLEHLLKVYPEAATVRDASGRLPLHIAIGWRAPLSVLELLLRAAPDAGEAVCRRRDDIMLNFPPVLMAAANDCDLDCIFTLLHYAPTITKRQVTFISRKNKSPPA